MNTSILRTILISLVTLWAAACGDAGDQPFEDDAGFVEEEGGFGDEEGNDAGQDDDENEPVEEGEDDEGEVEEEDPIATCGDGFVDDAEQCDDGNVVDGDGCSSTCEHQVVQMLGQIEIDLTVDDLESNEEPLSDRCSGPIEIELDLEEGTIVGDGDCALDGFNNFLTYHLDANFVGVGVIEGTLDVVLNGQVHRLNAAGFIDKDLITLEFDGVTLLTARIRGVWSGEIEAARN